MKASASRCVAAYPAMGSACAMRREASAGVHVRQPGGAAGGPSTTDGSDTSTRGSQSRRIVSRRSAFSFVLSGTATAPAAIAPQNAAENSGPSGSTSATRSPAWTPSFRSTAANRRTRPSSSP